MDAIRRIVQSLRVASRAAEQQFGLSAAQLFVLQKLAEGEAASLNELAERTLTHQSSVSVVVTRLVKAGLVARVASRKDARRIVLSLTPRGRALLGKTPQAAQERLIDAIKALPGVGRRQLAILLGRVAQGLSAGDRPPSLLFEDSSDSGKRHKQRKRIHGSR